MKTATKTTTYFTVITLETTDTDAIGSWAIHFGDFDREVAEAEADDVINSYGTKKAKVLRATYSEAQADAQAQCDTLNAKLQAKRDAQAAKVAATSAIIYEGPSLIDGAPIVAIATVGSSNSKTGDMVQTWIIRTDVPPIEANRTGLDIAICGNCPHKGVVVEGAKMAQNRTCYVNIGQAPTSVYKAYKRGAYRKATTAAAQAAIGAGRMVRIGSYGDGAAVPADVWEGLKADAKGHTAYSHQFDTAAAPSPSIYMHSADTLADAQTAWAAGRRTFRIVAEVAEIVKGSEIECPSDRGVKCADCGLCDGSKRAKSVAIVVHGTGAKHFTSAVQ